MKKRIAVFTVLAGLCYIVISAYSTGASQICCGAKGAQTNCAGTACHGATPSTGTDTYIRVDSLGGIPVGGYVPGATYTVTVGGSNALNQPKFGFQFTAVKGSGTSEMQAGSYAGFPTFVSTNYYAGLIFVEHTQGITPTTPGVYQKSFQWVAPAAGSGIVKMYLTMLAVNANTYADAGDQSGNVSITLMERPVVTAVDEVNSAPLNVIAYPNPVANELAIQLPERAGLCTIHVYDLNGKMIATEQTEVNGMPKVMHVNTSNWQPGIYWLSVGNGQGVNKTITVIKH